MLKVEITRDEVHFGASVTVRCMRTLRAPADGREYALPVNLGGFPIFRVRDYLDRVPASWHADQGVFIPLHQCEAMWISLAGRWWKPNAVKVGVGGINAITGEPWIDTLSAEPQDYLVCPDQPALDGATFGHGGFRQFAARSLDGGHVVGGQSAGEAAFDCLELVVYEPKAQCFPDRPPHERVLENGYCRRPPQPEALETDAAPDRRLRQPICADVHGLDTWAQMNKETVYVHLVNGDAFQEITGHALPPTPVSAKTYHDAGLPWLDPYNEYRLESGTTAATERHGTRAG
jgi:hypothetical protein